ncbi:MAG: hypothetical protein ACK5LC_07275 [Coprobacillaceae bacterium]
MKLQIVSPAGLMYEEEVKGFSINTNTGERSILDRHGDFIAFYQFSDISILYDEKATNTTVSTYYVALGYLYVSDNKAYIIAQLASDKKEEIQATYNRILKIRGDNANV